MIKHITGDRVEFDIKSRGSEQMMAVKIARPGLYIPTTPSFVSWPHAPLLPPPSPSCTSFCTTTLPYPSVRPLSPPLVGGRAAHAAKHMAKRILRESGREARGAIEFESQKLSSVTLKVVRLRVLASEVDLCCYGWWCRYGELVGGNSDMVSLWAVMRIWWACGRWCGLMDMVCACTNTTAPLYHRFLMNLSSPLPIMSATPPPPPGWPIYGSTVQAWARRRRGNEWGSEKTTEKEKEEEATKEQGSVSAFILLNGWTVIIKRIDKSIWFGCAIHRDQVDIIYEYEYNKRTYCMPENICSDRSYVHICDVVLEVLKYWILGTILKYCLKTNTRIITYNHMRIQYILTC